MYTIGGELYHYGVKGMKWGVRRYQPYGSGYVGKTKGKFQNLQGSVADRQRKKELKKKAKEYQKNINEIEMNSSKAYADMINDAKDASFYDKLSREQYNKYYSLTDALKASKKGQRLMDKGKKYEQKMVDMTISAMNNQKKHAELEKEVNRLIKKIDSDPDVISYQSLNSVAATRDAYASRVVYESTRVKANSDKEFIKNLKRQTVKSGEKKLYKTYYY